MALYMLDTDIATALIRGKTPVLDRRVASIVPEELCISAITRGELLYGASRQLSEEPVVSAQTPAGIEERMREQMVQSLGHLGRAHDEASRLGDVIEDWPDAFPMDQATVESLRKTTHEVLAQLTPETSQALRKRFGIDMKILHRQARWSYLPARPLEDIGKQFDVTRERVRQQGAHRLSRVVDQFLARVPCLPWDEAAAAHFAAVAVKLERAGDALGTLDTMIAAHAMAVGAVLVTARERHFACLRGLKVEDWTQSL